MADIIVVGDIPRGVSRAVSLEDRITEEVAEPVIKVLLSIA